MTKVQEGTKWHHHGYIVMEQSCILLASGTIWLTGQSTGLWNSSRATFQLRALKPPTDGAVMSVKGGPLQNGSRVGLEKFGPIQSHDGFHQFLRGDIPMESFQNMRGIEKVVNSHRQHYATICAGWLDGEYWRDDRYLWRVVGLTVRSLRVELT